MAGDIKRKATLTLSIDAKDMEKQIKGTVSNLKSVLSSLDSASNKMSFFKNLTEYIDQLDQAMGNMKGQNGQVFQEMFGGMDESFKAQMEKVFGIAQEKIAELNALKGELLNANQDTVQKGQLKQWEDQIRSIYELMGQEVDLSGKGKFETRINKMVEAVNNFATVWEGMRDKVSNGLNFGGGNGNGNGSGSDQAQKTITELENKIKTIKSLKQELDSVSAMTKKYGEEEKVKLDFKTDTESLRQAVAKFEELAQAKQNFEQSGDTSSLAYYQNLIEYTKMATQLTSAYYNLDKNPPDFLENLIYSNDFDSLISDFSENISNSISSGLQSAISDAENQIARLKSEMSEVGSGLGASGSGGVDKRVQENEKLILSYDELKSKIEEINEAVNQRDTYRFGTEEYDQASQKVDKLIEDFNRLYVSESRMQEVGNMFSDLFDLGERDLDDGFLKELYGMLNTEVPQGAQKSQAAIDSLTQSLQNMLSKATKQEGDLLKGIGNDNEMMSLLNSDKIISEFTGEDMKVGTDAIVSNLAASLKENVIMSLHNHPDGADAFTASDIRSFANLFYGQGTKINGIIANEAIKTIDFSGISKEMAIQIAESYSKNLQEAAAKYVLQDGSKIMEFKGGELGLSKNAESLTGLQYDQLVGQMLQEANAALEKAFADNGLQSLVKTYTSEQLPELTQYLTQIQQSGENAITPVEKLKNLLTTLNPNTDFNWDSFKDIFASLDSGKISGGDAFGQSKARIAELQQQAEQATKVIQQFNEVVNSANNGMYDVHDANNIEGQMDAYRAQIEELYELGQVSDEVMQKVNEDYASVKSTIESLRGASNTREDLAGLNNEAQFATTIQQLEEIIQKRQELTNMAENAGWFNESELENEKAVTQVLQERIDLQKQLAQEKLSSVDTMHDKIMSGYFDDVEIGQYKEQLSTLKSELEQLAQQGAITSEQLENAVGKINNMHTELTHQTSNYTGYGSGDGYSYSFWDEYAEQRDRANELQAENETLRNEISTLQQKVVESIQVAQGQVGDYQQTIDALQRIEQAINNVVNAFAPLNQALSEEGGLFAQMAQNGSQAMQSLQENITNISQGFMSIGEGSGISNMITQIEEMKTSLTTAMTEFKDLSSLFSGANFNLNIMAGSNNNPIARNAQYGTAARETIKSLKEQATELESVFKEVYKSSDGMQAVVKGLGQNGMLNQDKIDLLGNLGDKTASLKVQMQTYREYIALLQELASKSNIDISKAMPQTSKSADQMVQDTEKILTGEKELEDSTNRLKNIFGSEIGISNLEQQITRVIDKLEELRAQLESLSNGVKVDGQAGAFDNISQSLTTLVENGTSLKDILVNNFKSISEAAESTREAIMAVSEAMKEAQSGTIAKDATNGLESQTVQSAQESANAVAQETEQMNEVAASAENAAQAKEKFAQANANVNSSAQTSVQGLQEETSAMEEATEAIEASQEELAKSRNESEKILGGMRFDTSDLDLFTSQINDFAHALAESKDLELSTVSVNMDGEYNVASAQITMINEKLGQTVTETYAVAHASEEMAEGTEEAEQAMESLYLASVKVRQSNVDNSGNVESTIVKLKEYEDKVKSIRATFEAASNPTKPITNVDDLKEINDLISKIDSKIGEFRDNSGNVIKFISKSDQAELKSYLNDVQLLVKAKQNKEWVATSLRTKDADTINSEFKQQLETFKANIKGSDVAGSINEIIGDLDTKLAQAFDKDSLTAWMNQFDLAKEKFKTLKAEFNATNKQQAFDAAKGLKTTELELYTQRFKDLGMYVEEDKQKAGSFTAELERLDEALKNIGNQKALNNWGKEFTALQKRSGIMVNQIKEYDTAFRKMNEMKSNVDKMSLSRTEKNMFYSQFDKIQNVKSNGLFSAEELATEEQTLTSIYNVMMKVSTARADIKNQGKEFIPIDKMIDEKATSQYIQNYAQKLTEQVNSTMLSGTFSKTGANSFQWLVQDADGAVSQIKATFDSLGKITITDQTTNAINNAQKSLQGVYDTLGSIGNLTSNGVSVDDSYITKLTQQAEKLQQALESGDKGAITNATKDTNKVVQDINKVIEAYKKMQAQFESGEATQIFPKDTSGSVRDQLISAVKEYTSTMPKATVEIGKFDSVTKTLTYTITDSQNNMTTMKASVDSLTGSMSTQAVSVQRVASEWEKFKAGFAAKARSFTQYLTYMTSIYRVISTIKSGIGDVKAIDSALTQLQIVTKESAQTLEEFANSAAESAQRVGSSITDLLSSVETWSRLGYSLKDSLNLAEYTSMFSNVADIDIDSATSSLTSILKAFGYQAQDVSGVTDILTAVGANYAVSASELGEALQNGGSALEAAGNSLEQSVALIAAGNASVQDASAVGNALKTTTMRIRGAKAELEDAGEEIDDLCESSSKMRKEILELSGVDIMIDDSTFKDTYQIMTEIAEVWDNLSDVSQAALLEDLAGKRNSNTVKSIITNINDLTGAYETAQNAAGETAKANQIYMDSIEGRSKQFSTSTENFWKNFISTDYVKNVVSDGTALINFLDTTTGKVTALGVALGALMAKAKINPLKMMSQMFDTPFKDKVAGVALNTGATATSLLDNKSIEAYQAAVKGLTAEQQANVLASAGFSEAQIQAALAANGVTEATEAETLAEEASAAAKAAQEGATVGQVLAENGVEAAKLSEAAATWLEANASETLTLAKLQEALQNGVITEATFAEIAAKMGLIEVNYSLGASIKAIFASNPVGLILMIVSAVLMAIPAIQSLGNAAEKSAERASEAVEDYKKKLSGLKQQKTDTEDLASAYNRLSKGVNTATNANIGLTVESYNEYLDVCNQIADMYPQLVSGYDAQGNAIIDLKGNVDQLTESYKEAAEAAALEFLTPGNKKDIWSSYESSVLGKNLDEQKKILESIKRMNDEDLAAFIEDDKNGFSSMWDKLRNAMETNGVKMDDGVMMDVYNNFIPFSDEDLADIDTFRSKLNSKLAEINQDLSSQLSDMKQTISASLIFDDIYNGLDDSSQAIVKSIIGNMDASMIAESGAKNVDELISWVHDNIVTELVDDINNEFDNADIYKSITGFSDKIAKAMADDDGNAFKQAKADLQEYLQLDDLGWEFDASGFAIVNDDDDAITKFLKNMVNQLETQSANYEAKLNFKTDFEDNKPENKNIVQDWLDGAFDEGNGILNGDQIDGITKSIVRGFEDLELPDLSQKVVDAFAGDDGKLMSDELQDIWEQGSTALETGDWGDWDSNQQAAWVALDAIMNAYGMDIETVKQSLIDLKVVEQSLEDIKPFDFASGSTQDKVKAFQDKADIIKETWNSLNNGDITKDGFISLLVGDFAEDADKLMNGVDFSDDNWMVKAKENLEALNNVNIEDFITQLTRMRDAALADGKDTTSVEKMIAWAESLKGQSLLEVETSTDTDKIALQATTLTGLTEAQESYNEILQQTNEILYDGQVVSEGYYESLKEHIDDVEELDSCFDKNNKQIIKNAAKLKNLIAQQRKEQQSTVRIAKAQAQLQYKNLLDQVNSLTNGKQWLNAEELEQLQTLQNEIDSVKSAIDNYTLLEIALSGATDAYNEYQNAQQRDSDTDYKTPTVDMISTIMNGFDTGEVGTEAFLSATKGLLGIAADTEGALDTIWYNMTSGNMSKFFTYADGEFSITEKNMENFVAAAQKAGVMTGDSFEEFEIVAGTSLETFANKMGMSKDAAIAFLDILSDYTISGEKLWGDLSDFAGVKAIDDATASYEELLNKRAELIKSGQYNGELEEQIAEKQQIVQDAYDANKKKVDEYITAVQIANALNPEVDTSYTEQELTALVNHYNELFGTEYTVKVNTDGSLEIVGAELETVQQKINTLDQPTQIEIETNYAQIVSELEEAKAKKEELDKVLASGQGSSYVEFDISQAEANIAWLEDQKTYYEVTYGITPAETSDTSGLDKIDEYVANGATISVYGETGEFDTAIDESKATAEEPVIIPVSYNVQPMSASEQATTSGRSIIANAQQQTSSGSSTVTTNFQMGTGYEEVMTAITTLQTAAALPITQHVLITDDGSTATVNGAVTSLKTTISTLTGANIEVTQSGVAGVEWAINNAARDRTCTITVNKVGGEWTGTAQVPRSALVSGTAHASGNWGLPTAEKHALVGELGRETVVDPFSGSYYTVGDNGAEFVDLPQGAIVFNHKQTEDLFKHGHINSRGKLTDNVAFASGTAHARTYTTHTNWTGNQSSSSSGSSSSSRSGSSSSSSSDSSDAEEPEVFDWIEVALEEINKQIDLMTAKLENAVGISAKNSLIDEIINADRSKLGTLNQGLKVYEDYANSLLDKIPSQYRDMAKNGAIAISEFASEADKETLTAIQNYREWAEKVTDTKQQVEELTTAIADLAKQRFDNVSEGYQGKIDLIESRADRIEALNSLSQAAHGGESSVYYQALIKENDKNIKELQQQRKDMQAALDKNVLSGDIKKYSSEWYKEVNAIAAVDTEIIKATEESINFKKSIADLRYDRLDNLVGRFESVSNEADNLIDILSNKDLVDESGNWTSEGIASLGLYTQKMEEAEMTATEYGKEINYLNKNWRSMGYTEQEYLEKLDDLKDGQYDAIKSYNDSKKAIVDLNKERVNAVKDGLQKEIDAYEELINKKKDELSAEKDLHDFRNNVNKQQKDIAALEKQLAAMAGDNSASAIAKRKQLEAKLAEARDELNETFYDHSITAQQDALDKELENFKKTKQDEIDSLEKGLEDQEKIIQDSYKTVQSNTNDIYKTLTDAGKEYGLSIADSITSPWQKGESAIQQYSEKFGVTNSATVDELNKLKSDWANTNQNIDGAAATAVQKVDRSFDYYQSATKIEEKPPESAKPAQTTTQASTSGTSGTPQKGSKVKIKSSAQNYGGQGGNIAIPGWVKSGGPYTVMQIGYNGEQALLEEIYSWVRIKDLEGYAKGTTGIKKSGMAIIDELGEELTMVAGKNGRLAYMTKGSTVIPSNITENLMQLGQLDPSDVLAKSKSGLVQMPNMTNNNIELDCSIGELIHIDNCTQDTLPDLRKIVDEALNKHTQKMNNALRKYVR